MNLVVLKYVTCKIKSKELSRRKRTIFLNYIEKKIKTNKLKRREHFLMVNLVISIFTKVLELLFIKKNCYFKSFSFLRIILGEGCFIRTELHPSGVT